MGTMVYSLWCVMQDLSHQRYVEGLRQSATGSQALNLRTSADGFGISKAREKWRRLRLLNSR